MSCRQLSISRQFGYQIGEGKALGNVAHMHMQKGDLVTAVGFLEQALAIFTKEGDHVAEAQTHLTLLKIYPNLGQHSKGSACAERLAPLRESIASTPAHQLGLVDPFAMAQLFG